MIWVPFVASGLALFVILVFAISLLKKPQGNEKMREISSLIQDGAQTFLKREYSYVFIVVGIVALFLVLLGRRGLDVNWRTAVCFVIGTIASALSGYLAMSIGTKANCRTAEAARTGLKEALSVSFTGGATTGLVVVGIGLLGLSGVFVLFGGDPTAINGYAMGASLFALFARAGGGIYTKGADMGADLVGKVEQNIPEDDPRNPAVIADNVGDNVGDTAGLGADLLESYVESIIAAIAIGTSLLVVRGSLVRLPLSLASWGIVSSIIGALWVKSGRVRDPQNALNSGVYLSAVLMILGGFFILRASGIEYIDSAQRFSAMGLLWCIIAGVISGIIIGLVSEFYTSYKYKPTKELAKSAVRGPAVMVVNGLGLGMGSTLIPVVIIGISILVGYKSGGIYGIALASFGMLSILGITLAVDSYGPVADNAGGIAQMAELPEEVRKITDSLDAVGNTTAAIGKGFAIGSAAFAAVGLFVAYLATINRFAQAPVRLSLTDPWLVVGLLVGGMIPYLFGSLLAGGVGRVAEKIIDEVRRQFKEIRGLIEGKATPDVSRCVDIATKGAIKSMMLPGILVIVIPVLVGVFLGPVVLAGVLMGALVTGLVLAIQCANTGAALDNAKKYIENGALGGKGTEAHKAAVIGDTVGDPLKDTIGPSINILIKLMTVISLVLAPLFVR
ncbi:MAG: sodium-translocating pyrophosphatase [candidate division WOR-3 bacterium]|nr:sodium-translocating pyrophosphatase [candidate division WOR-3 bacterium]